MTESSLKTVHVPHLGGIDAAYQMPFPYDPKKPTVIFINSVTTSSELYKQQFDDKALTDPMNLLAIEPLGHGGTRGPKHFTYWDTAIMNLQVMEVLGIPKAYVLGTSQGGWVTVRMALLAPDKIAGIIPVGTSMDSEALQTVSLGCWDCDKIVQPIYEALKAEGSSADEFELPEWYCEALIGIGFGKDCDSQLRAWWSKTMKEIYKGNDGKSRILGVLISLMDRDGLHRRLSDVVCPVLWLQGTADTVYSVANAEEEIKLFTNSPDAKLQTVEGAPHFLSATHPREIREALLSFVH